MYDNKVIRVFPCLSISCSYSDPNRVRSERTLDVLLQQDAKQVPTQANVKCWNGKLQYCRLLGSQNERRNFLISLFSSLPRVRGKSLISSLLERPLLSGHSIRPPTWTPYCCVHSLLLLIMHALILSLCNFVWGIEYISLAIRFWHLFVIIPAHANTTPNPPIPCSWHCPDCLRWSESLFHGIGLRTCSVGWWRRSSLFVFFLTGSRVSLIKRIREMRKPLLNGTERKNLIIILPFYSVKFKEAGT